MDVELVVAGAACVVMAAGHDTVGTKWVLPSVTEERLPATPFGPPSFTRAMVHVTWHIVTVFVVAVGGLLLTVGAADVDPRNALLWWIGGMWLAATAMAYVLSPTPLRSLARLPVPVVWVIVGVLCLVAAS